MGLHRSGALGRGEGIALGLGLVVDGGYPEWLAYLRERRKLLERYVDRQGEDALGKLAQDLLENPLIKKAYLGTAAE